MKLMIDECMGAKASRLVAGLLGLHKPEPIEAHFLTDYIGSSGTFDCDWSARLAQEGNWCVISCDYKKPTGQKAKSKGPPLHLILPNRKIIGFFLAGKMAQLSGFEKARATICVFPELWNLANNAAPGSRFKILPNGNGYKLSPWPLKAGLPSSLPDVAPPPSVLQPPSSLFPADVLQKALLPAQVRPSRRRASQEPPQQDS
ncbi:MAG TPA: hypothetical protein VHD56_17210 [Tepidisphaeraceae bacterium]|nr:hypothetical protein [Tepidisphaeraceae bacterium]